MSTIITTSAAQVFEVIVGEWSARISDIEQLVLNIEEEKIKWRRKESGKRNWSFELKLNRWAREGCRAQAGWNSPETDLNAVYPSPKMSADALVTVPNFQPLPVEVALVTNVTEDKWIKKINDDTKKLAEMSSYPGLQIVACFDTFDLERCDDWASFFADIDIWDKTSMNHSRTILSEGKMVVRGWEVSRKLAL